MNLAPFVLLGVLLAAAQSAALKRVELAYVRIAALVACFVVVAIVGFRPLFATMAGFLCTEMWMSVRQKHLHA